MERGARLVHWLAKISDASLDVLGFCGSCRFLVCVWLRWCVTCYHLSESRGLHTLPWRTFQGFGRLRIDDRMPSGVSLVIIR